MNHLLLSFSTFPHQCAWSFFQAERHTCLWKLNLWLSHICPYCHYSALLYLLLPFFSLFNYPFLSRHNQRSLEVQKDPDHKNRCRVRFPEVFSSFPYKVNVTAVNALGKASSTISFEESSIGKIHVVSCFIMLCCFLFLSPLPLLYSVVSASGC